ncbi:kinesin-like protein Klp10A [Leptinotarsa decemlineata]|uniref:kinesin-like protein Klp10A n=1 Tax=Leptinotarsa decemlineata TaxID=7539 RepID=UPI000C252DEF|nr:kinesin-like protein Klp10A [Leptinotarsa decemlineata]
MSILVIGTSILIRRSDGRVQPAVVSSVDYELQYVNVEWFENGEIKGKEIHFSSIQTLNPDIVIATSRNRENHSTGCFNKIDDSFVNKNKRHSSVGQENRVQSAKPRLTQSYAKNPSTIATELVVEGKRLPNPKTSRSVSENLSKFKESATLKKLNKLEQDRIERRKKNAEVKAEKEEFYRKNRNNPHWELLNMIVQYRNTIEFNPLSNADAIEDHLITVAVRKRPLNDADMQKKEIDIITIPSKKQLIVHEPKYKVDLTKYLENHTFTFDYTFDDNSTNEIVYRYTAQPLVKTVFQGGFATCFAYGQTGSGKTYTMSGNLADPKARGIYALTAADIFKEVHSQKYKHSALSVSCSFFEIYVKKVSDLLNSKKCLKILEDGRQQVQIVGLTEKIVNSVDEVLQLIKLGNEERASGQTSANSNSSRSHAVFQIYLRSDDGSKKLHGKFSLIDLAGNERGADTFSSSKITRLEGSEINQSLLSLKECIRALGRKGTHLPFRGSKLTQVLRDSFVGANSKTCMIAMVSPGVSSCENTLNTLRYADRVKELGGCEIHLNKSSENDFNDASTSFYSSHSITASPNQKSFEKIEKPRKMKLEDRIIGMHKEVVRKLKKSSQEAEELLLTSKYDVEKYNMNWNMLIEDVVTYLRKAKI